MPGLQMKYFVLKPKGNDPYAAASRAAMHQYAKFIEQENRELAKELRDWAANEGADAHLKEGGLPTVEDLRKEQAERVMPVVGGLLDCLDGIDNDTRGQLEELAPELFDHLASLHSVI